MKVTGANSMQVKYAAVRAGLVADVDQRTDYLLVRLKLGDDKRHYQSINIWYDGTRRRTGSVCYHGTYEWLRNLAKLAPNAQVYAGSMSMPKIHYDLSSPHWTTEADEYGNIELGSQIYPFLLREKCNCEH